MNPNRRGDMKRAIPWVCAVLSLLLPCLALAIIGDGYDQYVTPAWVSAIDQATLAFGLLVFLVSTYWCVFFARSDHPLGQSVALMLFGESCAGAVTAVFSAENVFEWLVLSYLTKTAMRWAIYLPVGVSTMHLSFAVVRQINEDLNSGRYRSG